MKRRLLKVPQNHGEIVCLPPPEDFFALINVESIIGLAHQPYFFHPGISLKFLFLKNLPRGQKEIIFVDTDRVDLQVHIPFFDSIKIVELVHTDSVLDDFPTPEKAEISNFFNQVENCLSKAHIDGRKAHLANLFRFRELFFKNSQHRYLKEVLAESFLQFFNLKRNYCFLSDLIRNKLFQDFFRKIFYARTNFKDIFNQVLDEFRENFRFRFRNYPFPKLAPGELPFWIVKNGRRFRCFEQDISPQDPGRVKIFPRAVTLTIFLRLHKFDFFIHGISGANYAWVQDRIMERFFHQAPPAYAVVSGTFRIGKFKERNFPYFLFSPRQIEERLATFMRPEREKWEMGKKEKDKQGEAKGG